MEQQKKQVATAPVPLAQDATVQKVVLPDIKSVLDKANKGVEQANKKVVENEKMIAITKLINQNMRQMKAGEKVEGSCTC